MVRPIAVRPTLPSESVVSRLRVNRPLQAGEASKDATPSNTCVPQGPLSFQRRADAGMAPSSSSVAEPAPWIVAPDGCDDPAAGAVITATGGCGGSTVKVVDAVAVWPVLSVAVTVAVYVPGARVTSTWS